MVYRVDGRRADHGSSHGTPGRDVLSDGVFSIHLSSIFKVDVPARRACGTKGQATKVFGRQGFRGKYRNRKGEDDFPRKSRRGPDLATPGESLRHLCPAVPASPPVMEYPRHRLHCGISTFSSERKSTSGYAKLQSFSQRLSSISQSRRAILICMGQIIRM